MRARLAGFLGLTLLVLGGCSGAIDGEVSGSVNVDGQPAENGAVSFFPVDGHGHVVTGMREDGADQLPRIGVVFDHQDSRHVLRLRGSASRAVYP